MNAITVKVLVSFLLGVLVVQTAQAQENCSSVFVGLKEQSKNLNERNKRNKRNIKSNQNELGRIVNQKIVDDLVYNKNNNYVVKIVPDRGPILDQGHWGLCHLYALFAELTREYKARNGGKDPDISIYYFAFHYLRGRALETLKELGASIAIQEGGMYPSTFGAIREVGAFLKSDWKALGGTTDLELSPQYTIQSELMQKFMLEAKMKINAIDLLFKNDFSDNEKNVLGKGLDSKSPEYNTNIMRRYYNAFLENMVNDAGLTGDGSIGAIEIIKGIVVQKKKELAVGKTTMTRQQIQILEDLSKGYNRLGGLTRDQIKSLRSAFNADMVRDLNSVMATIFFKKKEIPKEIFSFEKNRKLANDMFPEMKQVMIGVSIDKDNKNSSMKFTGSSSQSLVNFSTSAMVLAEIIAKQVEESGNGVWIGYDHDDKYVDNTSGLMSKSAIQFNVMNPGLSRQTREDNDIYYGGHAVQIVGTIRNAKTGELVGFKIQNSWSEKAGDGGIYTMDMDYFKSNAWVAFFRDEKGQFNQEQQEELKKQVKDGKKVEFPKEVFLK